MTCLETRSTRNDIPVFLLSALLWTAVTASFAVAQDSATETAGETAPDAEEAPAPPPAWSASAGLSYLATSGNTDTQTLGFDVRAARRPMPWGFELTAQFDSVEQDGEKTAERYFAGLRGTRSLSPRWDVFAGLSAEQDEFSGIDLRGIFEAGGTYHAIGGPRHILDLDVALTYTDEQRLAPEVDEAWLGGLVGLSYEMAISDNATFSQDLVYRANFDETDDWRADSLTAVTAALNQRLALKLSYELRYRNQPIGLASSTDTNTRLSLVWNL